MTRLEAAAEIRALVAKRGIREHFPAAVKAKILDHVSARRAAGASFAKIATELGVGWRTLARWSADTTTKKSPRFRRVEVRRDEPAPSSSRAAIVLASGVRVEHATVAEIVAILRLLA